MVNLKGSAPYTAAVVDEPSTPAAVTSDAHGGEVRLPGLSRPLRPLVDLVARIKASVHVKLLSGFLAGAVLLLGMGIMSLIVIDRMSGQVRELELLEQRSDWARQMEYAVTAQSHYRAMALLTKDDTNNDKIANAKTTFAELLDKSAQAGGPDQALFFAKVRDANNRFTASSAQVLALYKAGDIDGAMKLHLAQEHTISHELEQAMRDLIASVNTEMTRARAAFQQDRELLSTLVVIFSVVSLLAALFLGFVLSWAFVLPVRRIDRTLARIAAGDFGQRVEVANRDELGTLSQNLNTTSQKLSSLYEELRSLNATLQERVNDQVKQLERSNMLKRYLSPQLAESIVTGTLDVNIASRRKNLTVFFSDVRGFTAISERTEPEELTDMLNQYLSAMTEIVFAHGGTLDKYIGDSIMVFFGDPIPYEDHAARAVRMAFAMRLRLGEMQQRWFARTEEILTMGMGISTGYVTVGNIGSAARLEYTVLGNHVNLASRLADEAKAGQILVSDRTLTAVEDFVTATEVKQIELQGVSRPIRIYEVNEKTAVLAPAS